MINTQQSVTNQLYDAKDTINHWLDQQQHGKKIPLYSSVDIRQAGFKASVIDHNLFPAGFNNLSGINYINASNAMQLAIKDAFPNCKNILLICEEHTRNTWYLENVRILNNALSDAGFNIVVATFMDSNESELVMNTATHNQLIIKNMNTYMESMAGIDLVILNNDLTNGIPNELRRIKVPIIPSMCAGWHSRLKSDHFRYVNEYFDQLGELVGFDPWLYTAKFDTASNMDINNESDRSVLHQKATQLLNQIEKKYAEYQINEKPFIFLKSDSGTYGMGVKVIEDPDEIIQLNRKNRNRLSKGKHSKSIDQFILQEGIPSALKETEGTAEVCIYQVSSRVVGGFYRVNTVKNGRDNLNSTGMMFKPMSTDCNPTTYTYHILSQIASLAVTKEIDELEKDCG